VAADIFAKRQQITLGVEEPGAVQSHLSDQTLPETPGSVRETIEKLRVHF
jgi:hypothetical protein